MFASQVQSLNINQAVFIRRFCSLSLYSSARVIDSCHVPCPFLPPLLDAIPKQPNAEAGSPREYALFPCSPKRCHVPRDMALPTNPTNDAPYIQAQMKKW